jgi:hypothetical protein
MDLSPSVKVFFELKMEIYDNAHPQAPTDVSIYFQASQKPSLVCLW